MASPLFVSLDPFGPLMAGPAVRSWELAAACVDAGLSVTVAAPVGSDRGPDRCALVTFDPADPSALDAAAAAASAVIVQGTALARFPGLVAAGVPLVVDLYCPFLLENLERVRAAGGTANTAGDAAVFLNELRGLNTALAHGDFFLCANARQREYWVGALTALHRVNPATYRDDPQLFGLLATVPFGCPSSPPASDSSGWRARVAGLADDSDVLLWGGSVSPWFDLDTLIRAVGILRDEHPTAALVLLGARHPNADVPESPAVVAARTTAEELGLLDAGVHFLPWVPYAERGRYLSDAALGVSTHGKHLEAHFAFRTRLVDYAWGRLPMVLTRGDGLAARCAAMGAALAVEPGDVDALAAALARGLEDRDWRSSAQDACAHIAADFTWARVALPLVGWLRAPRRAADVETTLQPVVLPPTGAAIADPSAEEMDALRAEAARARVLDARLRTLDRRLRLLEQVPGLGWLLKRRRGG